MRKEKANVTGNKDLGEWKEGNSERCDQVKGGSNMQSFVKIPRNNGMQ